MWLVVSKKELKRELDLIKSGFKERDDKIDLLKAKLESHGLKIAIIEGMLSTNRFGPSPDNSGTEPNRTSLETKKKRLGNSAENYFINRLNKERQNKIKETILELINKNMRTSDMFRYVVQEKRLISKTQFYHYLGMIRNGLRTELKFISKENALNKNKNTSGGVS